MNKVFFDGYEWYVAESPDEALKLQAMHTGETEFLNQENLFIEQDENQLLTIAMGASAQLQTKTMRQWAIERQKGFLASTEQ